MGVGVEVWRARVGVWHCRGPRWTGGPGNTPTLLTLLLATFSKVRIGAILSNCKWSAGSLLDLACKSTLVLISAMVNYGLMFDVETNPGPPTHACKSQVGLKFLFTLHLLTPPSQAQCPGCGVLGPQPGVLHCGTTTDPLERLLGNSTYSMGGAARYITSLSTAIKAFIDRYYPRAGKKGLLVVPELPSTTEDITWEMVTRHMVHERHGGLLAGTYETSHLAC